MLIRLPGLAARNAIPATEFDRTPKHTLQG